MIAVAGLGVFFLTFVKFTDTDRQQAGVRIIEFKSTDVVRTLLEKTVSADRLRQSSALHLHRESLHGGSIALLQLSRVAASLKIFPLRSLKFLPGQANCKNSQIRVEKKRERPPAEVILSAYANIQYGDGNGIRTRVFSVRHCIQLSETGLTGDYCNLRDPIAVQTRTGVLPGDG